MRLIDGDALMERLGIAYDCSECDQDKAPYCMWKPDVIDVCEAICDAPTIEPGRKKGKWIHVHPLQSDDPGAYMCSECRTGNWEIDPESYFFCPYCGADMRGEQE